jgi:hypothetical protein
MRTPRLRFTVRQMMVIVAIVAVALIVAIPVSNRLLWLYRAPSSINLVGGVLVQREMEKPGLGDKVEDVWPSDAGSWPRTGLEGGGRGGLRPPGLGLGQDVGDRTPASNLRDAIPS